MKKNSLIALTSLFVPFFAFSSPFYKQVEMPDGPFKGQTLDTSVIRSIVYLNGTELQVPNANESKYGYVANVQHEGKFYVARIPKSAPRKVDFIYEKFTDMPGGHADLVYQMDKKQPIELIYEIRDRDSSKGYELIKVKKPIKLTDVVYTAEAVKVIGDKSGLVEGGLTNKFAISYRLTSIPQRLSEPVLNEGRKTSAIDIPFDIKATQRSFWNSIETYSRIGVSSNYHLINNNCITSAVTALSLGLNEAQRTSIQTNLSIAIENVNRLGKENISEAEMQRILNSYIETIQNTKTNLSVSSIFDKPYFTDWMDTRQKAQFCPLLFQGGF